MEATQAVAWVAATVLAWAGVAKLRHPRATSDALRLAGLPSSSRLARMLGVGEVALAFVVLAIGGPVPAVGLCLTYAAFAAYAERHRRRPGASCGCFGDDSAPLTLLHVVTNAVMAAAAGTAASVGAMAVPAASAGTPVLAAATVALVAAAAGLVTMLLTSVPRLLAALGARSAPDRPRNRPRTGDAA